MRYPSKMNLIHRQRSSVFILLIICTTLAKATAQELTEHAQTINDVDEVIIVSGSNVERQIHHTPLAITTFDSQTIERLSFGSQADILRHIQGIKAEGGGGDLATNVAVVGMPFAGQYEFTPLMYDGLPAFSTFGLNSSASDVYIRNDLSIERLEFVRGGVVNLFGPASAVGLINYISKSPLENDPSIIQWRQSSENGSKFDFYHTHALNADSGLSLSGFLKYDKGPLDTGLSSSGGQLKLIYEKQWERNNLSLYSQWINDSTQFYLPLPLDGMSQSRIEGNDGHRIQTLQTSSAKHLAYPLSENEQYRVDIADGIETQGGMVAFNWQHEFQQWASEVKGKYADYKHEFNLFLDGDGLTGNVPLSTHEYLTARGIPKALHANYAFKRLDGQLLTVEDLVFGNRILDRQRPARDLIIEANIVRTFKAFEGEQTMSFGLFYSDATAYDINAITGYLTDFNNKPQLLDVSFNNGEDHPTLALNGLVQSTGFTKHHKNTVVRKALYWVVQIDWQRFSLDIGARIEQLKGKTTRKGINTYQVPNSSHLHALLQTSKSINDDVTAANVSDSAASFAIGAVYKLTEQINLFANYSDSFSFPQLRTIQLDENLTPNSFEEERLTLAEAGLKLSFANMHANISTLYSTLTDRRLYNFVNAPDGGITEQIDNVATRMTGIQGSLHWQLTDRLQLNTHLTYQDLQYTEFDRDLSFVGNQPVRTADWIWDLALNYHGNNWYAALNNTFQSDTFANNANTITLDAFHLTSANIGYDFASPNNLSIELAISNLFNSQGITEGSPRQGDHQSANEYFVGRPVLPRRFHLSLRYQF